MIALHINLFAQVLFIAMRKLQMRHESFKRSHE